MRLILNAARPTNHAASIQVNCYKSDVRLPIGPFLLATGFRRGCRLAIDAFLVQPGYTRAVVKDANNAVHMYSELRCQNAGSQVLLGTTALHKGLVLDAVKTANQATRIPEQVA